MVCVECGRVWVCGESVGSVWELKVNVGEYVERVGVCVECVVIWEVYGNASLLKI